MDGNRVLLYFNNNYYICSYYKVLYDYYVCYSYIAFQYYRIVFILYNLIFVNLYMIIGMFSEIMEFFKQNWVFWAIPPQCSFIFRQVCLGMKGTRENLKIQEKTICFTQKFWKKQHPSVVTQIVFLQTFQKICWSTCRQTICFFIT